MVKSKKKQEVNLKDKKYQWDLKGSIFNKEETPESVLSEWYKSALKMDKTGKDLYRSAKRLKEWLELYIKTSQLRARYEAFIAQKLKDFPKATKWKSLDRKFQQYRHKINKSKNPYGGQVILRYEKKIKEYLKQPELKQYKILVEREFFTYKGHQINSEDSKTIEAVAAYDALNVVFDGIIEDCKELGYRATDAKGKTYTTDEGYRVFWKNKDPAIRESAWINYWIEYRKRIHEYAGLFYLVNYRTDQEARMFNYGSELERNLYLEYELSLYEYRDLLAHSKEFKNLRNRYRDHIMGMVNCLFKRTKFEPWDDFLLETLPKWEISPEEAKKIIYESFKIFGEQFANDAKSVMDSKLIQWSPNCKSSRPNYTLSGNGLLDKEPIQIDFKSDVDSVCALAHELGHSISIYYAKQHQKTYKMFNNLTSEIPSCVCQIATAFYLADTADSSSKRFWAVKYMLDYFFSAVSEYATDGLFKFALNNRFKRKGKLPADEIIENYWSWKKEYAGRTKLENQWAKTEYPHYLIKYRLFEDYYQSFNDNDGLMYFTGQICGYVIVNALLNKNDKARKLYLEFLKNGGAKNIKDVFKLLQLNMWSDYPYKMAKNCIKWLVEYIESFETVNKPGSLNYGKKNKIINGNKQRKK